MTGIINDDDIEENEENWPMTVTNLMMTIIIDLMILMIRRWRLGMMMIFYSVDWPTIPNDIDENYDYLLFYQYD